MKEYAKTAGRAREQKDNFINKRFQNISLIVDKWCVEWV
jgi:hypothetical protein